MSDIGLIAVLAIAAVVLVLGAHLLWFLLHTASGREPEVQGEPRPENSAAEQIGDGVQQGVRAFMRGDYGAAFNLLLPAAQGGNLRAQQLLAKMYYAGNGVEQDRDQYLYWLKRAADNGDKPAKAKVKKIESQRTAG